MAKAFSVVSWNVEHFGKKRRSSGSPEKPIGPIVDYLASQNADIVAVYEVVGKMVFKEVMERMPGYQFHITEGPQTQEILVGVKRTLSCFFTQKTTFKSGASMLRPGALLTITKDGVNYPLLFLHLKSLTEPKGFGLRDDMTGRAIKLKKGLDRAHKKSGLSGRSNFIFLGDLNTMGMNLTYSNKDVSADEEIKRLSKRLSSKSVGMKMLSKSTEKSYWPGSKSKYSASNLDHVVAADHLKFKKFDDAFVSVRGWVEESDPLKRDQWVEQFSDHALLYFEVQKI